MELTNNEFTELSKFISLILRHKPEVIDVKMDNHGWVNTSELINGISNQGYTINHAILKEIVETDSKNRYSFSKFEDKIRANQGHSVPVDLEFIPTTPPDILYHGTTTRFIDKIYEDGLKPMKRLYVHLSIDKKTAIEVGKRHGEPIVLEIDSKKMNEDGIEFYLSENGIWLTNFVDPKYFK